MSTYLSTSCHARNSVEEAVRWCHEISPHRVEISAPHNYQTLNDLEVVLRRLKEEGFALTLHNYFPPPEDSFVLNMAADEQRGKSATKSLVEGALRLARAAGSPLYGIHAGYLSRADARDDGTFQFDNAMSSYVDALDRAVAFVHQIAPKFRAQNVHFLVENLFPSPKKRHSLFCTIEEIKEFMNQVPESVGVLLDLGHLNVSSVIMEFDRDNFLDEYLQLFSDRLIEVHVSENQGLKDEHLAVKEGSWQLEAIRRIHDAKNAEGTPRVYCVEARNASVAELHNSLSLVDEIVA